jgi:hypothetical protein
VWLEQWTEKDEEGSGRAGGTDENTKNFSHDGRDSNLGPSEYEAEVTANQPQCSTFFLFRNAT